MRIRIAFAAALSLAATHARAAEPALDAHLPGPESARSMPDWSAVRGGAILFGVGYGAALVAGADQHFRGDDGWLAVPVVGPWARLSTGSSGNGTWGWVADGVAQGGGALIIAGGFMFRKRVLGPAQGAAPSIELALSPRTAALFGRF